MRTFIAGATGYTGRALVAHLCDAARREGRDAAEVVAHVRPDSSQRDEAAGSFEALGATVDLTPWDRAALTSSLQHHRPERVFALLGTTRSKAREAARHGVDAGYGAVDRDLTLMLLDACRKACPDATFVYLSSLGADSKSGNGYLRVRGEVEMGLVASGQPWIIAQPSFISGPDRAERRTGERVGAVVADGALALFRLVGAGRIADRFGAMSGAELARSLAAASSLVQNRGRRLRSDDLRELLRETR